MGHIYISYSTEDIVYTEKLVNTLRREGFNPWVDIDKLESGILGRDRAQQQVITCDAFILIMSKNSKVSQWVSDEDRKSVV